LTQVKKVVRPWRTEERERAFVRFETGPGEQAQMDWGHFGNWAGRRLYAFVLTLCWSRMLYVRFTQRQDIETLLNCLEQAFRHFDGVTSTVLTDNMKTVVTERVEGQPRFHPRFLDFASYYGFIPRVCHPYRPETKGKVESSIRFVRCSFWPPSQFNTLAELNGQAAKWCEQANRRVHATTRAIPLERWPLEGLSPVGDQPGYDTDYVSHRLVAKDCLLSYRGNRYSAPHLYAGKSVVVREGLDSNSLRIFHHRDLIAQHPLASGKGAMVIEPEHYRSLPRRSRLPAASVTTPVAQLTPGPGVGLHHPIPEVEVRPLAMYEEVAYVAAV
jgi:hypothetical protein